MPGLLFRKGEAVSRDIFQIDAFTDQLYSGNPAAVCFLDRLDDDVWMQNVATEINLSGTAFLAPQKIGYHLRWFTPTFEVDLCGHAMLASAHALWESGRLLQDKIAQFQTRGGTLTAARRGNWIELDLPSEIAEPCEPPQCLLEAIGLTPVFVGKNRFDYLVVIDSATDLRNLAPDFLLLRGVDTRGVIVTSPSDVGDFDFLSQFFASGSGIDEDPVTGSAH